jgi:hypothetical protein
MKTRIRWADWRYPEFEVNFKHQWNHRGSTCGGCLVSMITGEEPNRVDDKLRWRGDCKTDLLIRHLTKKGFEVAELGPRSVSDSRGEGDWQWVTLTDEHVVLFGAMTDRLEASWFLFWKGVVYHNFENWTNSPLFLLRNPAEDVLLIRK